MSWKKNIRSKNIFKQKVKICTLEKCNATCFISIYLLLITPLTQFKLTYSAGVTVIYTKSGLYRFINV